MEIHGQRSTQTMRAKKGKPVPHLYYLCCLLLGVERAIQKAFSQGAPELFQNKAHGGLGHFTFINTSLRFVRYVLLARFWQGTLTEVIMRRKCTKVLAYSGVVECRLKYILITLALKRVLSVTSHWVV